MFQVELHQLHGLQRVRFLFLRRPPTSGLKQRQLLAVLHLRKQLENNGNICNTTPTHPGDAILSIIYQYFHYMIIFMYIFSLGWEGNSCIPRGWRRVGLPPSGERPGSDWRRSRPVCKRLRPIRRHPGRTSPAPSGGRRCERAASLSCSSAQTRTRLKKTFLISKLGCIKVINQISSCSKPKHIFTFLLVQLAEL